MEKDLLINDFEKNYNVKINNFNVIKEDNGLVLNLDDKYILKIKGTKKGKVYIYFNQGNLSQGEYIYIHN